MSTGLDERERAMLALIPGILVQVAQPDGPNWDDGDLLAQEYMALAISPKEAVGTLFAVTGAFIIRACQAGGIDPVLFLQQLAAERAQ